MPKDDTKKDQEKTYQWSTTIVDVINPYESDAPHIGCWESSEVINCIPINTLREKPTSELLYLSNIEIVLHDNIPMPSMEEYTTYPHRFAFRKVHTGASTST